MIISYSVGAAMYLNITNKCSNDCVFCIRNFDHSLRLEEDPTSEDIWNDIIEREASFTEVVYCGFGEPMFRLDDVILALSPRIKETFSRPIRINTNGQAAAFYPERNIPKELADSGIDRISISLVAEEAWLYNFLCNPKLARDINDESVYRKVIKFIEDCREQEGLDVEVTALNFPILKMPQGIPTPNMQKCKVIADKLGIRFRVREYYGPHLYTTILKRYSK